MRSSLAEATLGSVHVFRKRLSERVVQEGCVPRSKLCFGVALGKATGTVRIQGHEVEKGTLFALGSHQEFSLHRPQGIELLAVTVGVEEFSRALHDSGLCIKTATLLSRPVLQVPLPALHRFRRALLRNFLQIPSIPIVIETARTSAHMAAQAVLDAVVDVLGAANESRQTIRNASAAYLVTRSHELVAGDVDQCLNIERLCHRLRTSRRTLQNSFMHVAGTTPLHYLRCVRLESVRRQLLAQAGPRPTIAQLAMSEGFTHLSRFAEQYRELFGELPSTTLKIAAEAKHRRGG